MYMSDVLEFVLDCFRIKFFRLSDNVVYSINKL